MLRPYQASLVADENESFLVLSIVLRIAFLVRRRIALSFHSSVFTH